MSRCGRWRRQLVEEIIQVGEEAFQPRQQVCLELLDLMHHLGPQPCILQTVHLSLQPLGLCFGLRELGARSANLNHPFAPPLVDRLHRRLHVAQGLLQVSQLAHHRLTVLARRTFLTQHGRAANGCKRLFPQLLLTQAPGPSKAATAVEWQRARVIRLRIRSSPVVHGGIPGAIVRPSLHVVGLRCASHFQVAVPYAVACFQFTAEWPPLMPVGK
mmetsp:Transcript_65397/g.181438  ORF Transcript_65397/g.181438 Transcript_65397/m.181438 type:complete len:215 (-) Transcript_65397:356-1000(-)